jgi:hypothetical protein
VRSEHDCDDAMPQPRRLTARRLYDKYNSNISSLDNF